MGISKCVNESTGLVGVAPRIVYIETDDSSTEVVAPGYIDPLVSQGYAFSEKDMALVSFRNGGLNDVASAFYILQKQFGKWVLEPASSNVPGQQSWLFDGSNIGNGILRTTGTISVQSTQDISVQSNSQIGIESTGLGIVISSLSVVPLQGKIDIVGRGLINIAGFGPASASQCKIQGHSLIELNSKEMNLLCTDLMTITSDGGAGSSIHLSTSGTLKIAAGSTIFDTLQSPPPGGAKALRVFESTPGEWTLYRDA